MHYVEGRTFCAPWHSGWDSSGTLLFSYSSHRFFIMVFSHIWKHTIRDRNILWTEIEAPHDYNSDPWLVGGDFNIFLSLDDHNGSSSPTLVSMEDSANCVAQCDLIDIPYAGTRYAWSCGRGLGCVWRRLDRLLQYWVLWQIWRCFWGTISRATSDHSLLLLICQAQGLNGPTSFQFWNAWTTHSDFLHYMTLTWNSYPTTGGTRGLCPKPKLLKKDLKEWNKSVFGNIFHNVTLEEKMVLLKEK